MDDEDKKAGIETDAVIIIGIIVLLALVPGIIAFFKVYVVGITGPVGLYWKEFQVIAKETLSIIITVSFPLSLFLLIAIVYCVEQLKHIRKKEDAMYNLKVQAAEEVLGPGDKVLTNRWEGVKTHVTSVNPSDWRQAIMEADIILEDILTGMGYRGEGIGEKLKRVEPGEIKSLQDAWEAHKVRNAVAHEGSEYPLTQHEAQRVINLYKKVFEEFYYI